MLFLPAILHFVSAFLLMWFANWLGLIAWRRAASAHWTERARLLWPARVTAASNVFLIPALLWGVHALFVHDQPRLWILNGLAALCGALLGCHPFDREIFPQLNFREWRHHLMAAWGIRLAVWVLFVSGIVLMPEKVGWRMAGVTAGWLSFHLAIQYGLFLKYLRWVKYSRPADDRLQRIVNESAAAMGIIPKATWQLNGPMALAYAFPTTGDLLFSDRLLEICSDEEVSAICVHEMAHLTESRWVVAGRLLGTLMLFPILFLAPCTHYFGMSGLFPVYAVVFLIGFTSRQLSQKMEKRADQLAVNKQLNEGVYANALEKLYRENHLPAVNVNNRQTHPHLYDRLVAAGITPEYERPKKPQALNWVGCLFFIALLLMAAMLGFDGFFSKRLPIEHGSLEQPGNFD